MARAFHSCSFLLWAKSNYVDHTLTDQTSTIHFIEDNWLHGERIGQGSFDAISGSVDNMFDFDHFNFRGGPFLLNPATGEPTGGGGFAF